MEGPSGGGGGGGRSGFQVTGMIEGFFGLWNFQKFCQVFFGVALGTFLGFDFCADSITPVT